MKWFKTIKIRKNKMINKLKHFKINSKKTNKIYKMN